MIMLRIRSVSHDMVATEFSMVIIPHSAHSVMLENDIFKKHHNDISSVCVIYRGMLLDWNVMTLNLNKYLTVSLLDLKL